MGIRFQHWKEGEKVNKYKVTFTAEYVIEGELVSDVSEKFGTTVGDKVRELLPSNASIKCLRVKQVFE